MADRSFPSLFPWESYSKKLSARLLLPFCVGSFTEKDARERGLFLASGESGEVSSGNKAHLFWLVDPNDGIVVDARFRAYGDSAFIGACEILSELVVGKNYLQAEGIGPNDIDQQVRDTPDKEAFPKEALGHITLALEALQDASGECHHIPLPIAYTHSFPRDHKGEVLEGGWPGWEALTAQEQKKIIEDVLDVEIRPHIALDAGGVDLLDLVEGKRVLIAYKGACTTCFSANGTTLSYIQHILRARVHPDLIVIPQWN
jgi:NifU-like protein